MKADLNMINKEINREKVNAVAPSGKTKNRQRRKRDVLIGEIAKH